MTDVFLKSELRALLEQDCGGCLCVSIYMPAHRGAGRETRQDPIRLKNLLRKAEEKLVETGLRRPEALKLLGTAEDLLEDANFWRNQSDGLAVFASEDFFKYYRLPVAFEELLAVSYRFHIKPLTQILSGDGRFYVLALSQDKVRLLQCTHYGARELPLTDIVPPSLDEFLQLDQLDRQYQYHYHTSTPVLAQGALIAHGPEISEFAKTNILRYFQQIDRGLKREILAIEDAPLVVAGVEYIISIFKEANTYHNMLDGGITGNPERLSADKLRQLAWDLVQPYFDRARGKAVRLYEKLGGTERISNDLTKIIPGSYLGLVDTLFVAARSQQWGTYEPAASTVELHNVVEPCDEDLLDFAIAHTLEHEGVVYIMKPEEIPGTLPVAAIFRYRPVKTT